MSSFLSRKRRSDGPKIRGVQAFFVENNDMAYYRPRKPPEDAPDAPNMPDFPGPVDLWDTMMAPLRGLWQGLGGKNLNYDQYIREKARKRRGMAPGSHPRRGPIGWLGRTITGK